MDKKKSLRRIYSALCAIIALMVVGGAVLQFHHHNESSAICFSVKHTSDGCRNHTNEEDCTMHLDNFLSGKHHFCFDIHCALCSKVLTVKVAEVEFRPVKAHLTISVPTLPDIVCRGLRAPPAMS